MEYGISIKVDGNPAPISVETGYIAIRESIDFFVPSATIVFKDRMSGFVSHYPFMQDTDIEVSIDDKKKINNHRFYAFSSMKELSVEGVESFGYSLDLISKYAKPLLTDGEFHSKKCTASDYVKYIADKCGLKSDIESTKEVRSWINPNWKYAQMIRFLAQRAVASSGSAGFLYFVRNDGTLVFKSVDKLFDEGQAIDLTAGSYTIETEEGEEQLNNKQLVIRDNHFASVILGANKLDLNVYDYKSGKNKNENVTYEKYLKKRAVIKGVAVDLATIGSTRYDGVWYSDEHDFPASTIKYVYNKVLRQLEATQLQIMAPLNNELQIGNVVNLSIPANADIITGGVNLNYSGRYLIKNLTTVGHGDFLQKLVLVRPGISLPNDRKPKYF